jgi:hypothetical protein
LSFEMHMIVLRTFRSVPPKLDLGETPQSFGASKRADVSVELAGNTSTIRAVESVVGPFEAALTETQVGAETLWIVTVQAPPGLPFGPQLGKVVLSTLRPDGTDGFPFEIEVSAQVVSDVVTHPSTLEFGRVERAAGAQLTAQLVALAPGAQVVVRAHRFEGQGAELLTARITPLDEQDSPRAQRWNIAVTLPPTTEPTHFQGQLVIETDDAGTPVVRVPFAGDTH